MKTNLVYGEGFNDANYVVTKYDTIEVGGQRIQKLVWNCPYYITWKNMLKRCYSTKYHKRHPTYKECTVADDWLTFTKFKEWMEAQDWKDSQLDKDILFEGNKIYSESTCVFVPRMVNIFLTDRANDRGDYLLGCYWNKRDKKFMAQCRNPLTKKVEYLGYFTSEQDGHNAWKARKLELAYEIAALQSDPRVAEALIKRYT